jgi:flagellar protein FlgJ
MKINPIQYTVQHNAEAQKNAAQTNVFKESLEKAMNTQDDKALKTACKQFETHFIHQMLKEMRSTVSMGEGLIPQNQGERMFKEMLDEEYAKNATEAGGIGLADMMFKQLSKDVQDKVKVPGAQPTIDEKL